MMSPFRRIALGALIGVAMTTGTIDRAAGKPGYEAADTRPDGQRDFDFELGSWITKVRVLRNPLSGQTPDWAEYRGTSIVRPLLDGRANFVELKVEGQAGRVEGGSLRLYSPQSRQWSLNYASLGNGLLTAPVYGGFDGRGRGRGAFFGQDTLGGRTILVRFIITPVSKDEIRFEQAYSADGGANWEINWIATDTRR
jgi:hypothetical protein